MAQCGVMAPEALLWAAFLLGGKLTSVTAAPQAAVVDTKQNVTATDHLKEDTNSFSPFGDYWRRRFDIYSSLADHVLKTVGKKRRIAGEC